jgi:hypothetical protein
MSDFPSRSKRMSLKYSGVGADANGYVLGSRLRRHRGGRMIKGGKLVVVVVVVVTTVVWVAGAKENWPMALSGARVPLEASWDPSDAELDGRVLAGRGSGQEARRLGGLRGDRDADASIGSIFGDFGSCHRRSVQEQTTV